MLHEGQVWRFRCAGKRNWMVVKRIMLTGYPGYDGALQGVSFDVLTTTGRKKDMGCFLPCQSTDKAVSYLESTGRYPAEEPEPREQDHAA